MINEYLSNNPDNNKELNFLTHNNAIFHKQYSQQAHHPTQLQRQLSTPSSSSMIPPPFPTIKQLNQHDFEEFIFSSGYLCCHCGGSFKSSKINLFLFYCLFFHFQLELN